MSGREHIVDDVVGLKLLVTLTVVQRCADITVSTYVTLKKIIHIYYTKNIKVLLQFNLSGSKFKIIIKIINDNK